VPAVKRIEESVEYNLERHLFPKLPLSVFTGETEKYFVTGNTYEARGIAWFINKKTSGEGWCSPAGPMFFNPQAYPFYKDDSDAQYNFLVCNTYEGKGTVGQYRYAEYSRNIASENILFSIKFGHPYGFNINDELVLGSMLKSVTVAVIIEQSGISQYLQNDGTWGTTAVAHVLPAENTSLMIPASAFNGKLMLKIQIHHIETEAEAKSSAEYIPIYSAEITQDISMLERNTVNTNYQSSNNVVVSRDPEFGPAYNSVALPELIKNGIFYREGGVIVPAKKWAFGRAGDQQMAVYNHLQLLAYYAKPNNLISGTIVNGDVTRVACIYDWHGAEHLLVSGTFNLLNGHIESAVLREFTRYEDMWSDVAGADMPDTEQESRSNMEGNGASGGGASSTYTNTTDVNVSGGGGGTGASYLNDLLDVNTDGVVNQSVLYYNGTSWVDMSLSQLLSPYVKLQSSSQTIKGDITIEGNLVITGDVASGGEGGNTSAEGTVTGVTVSGVDYTSVEAGLLDLTDLMALYALKSDSTKVSVSPSLSSGKPIGVISVDGVGTTLYAPATYAWSEISEKPNVLLFGGTSSQFLKADGSLDSTSYLSTSGGTMSGSLGMTSSEVPAGAVGLWGTSTLYLKASDKVSFYNSSTGAFNEILHSGNYSSYALPLTGGTIEGGLLLKSWLYVYAVNPDAYIRFYNNESFMGGLGIKEDKTPIFYDYQGHFRTLLHSGNVGEYALKIDGSSAMAGGMNWNDASVGTNVDTFGEGLIVGKTTDGGTTLDSLGYKYASVLNVSDGTYRFQIASAATNVNKLLYRGYDANAKSYFAWKTIAFTDSDITGNAAGLKHSNGTVGAIVNSSGNVTMGSEDKAGTTYKLHVGGKSHFFGAIHADNYNSGYARSAAILINKSGDRFGIGPSSINVANISFGLVSDLNGTWKSEFMVINNSGNVLIGTETDTSSGKLQIEGGVTLTGYMGANSVSKVADLGEKGLVVGAGSGRNTWGMAMWTEGNGNGFIQQQAFSVATTYALCLNPFGGNVGIGTENPSYKLDVAGTGRFTDSLLVSGTLTANSGATITGDVTINGNLIVTGDVASGGTGQDTPSGGSTSGVLTLTGEIPLGSDIPQSSLDAIGLTDQVIADMLIGKYHHVMYTSGITTYCFVVSGKYNSDYKAFTLHWGDDYMDEFMGYVFSLGSSGGWNITIYEI
jgi:hypothetical protein